MADYLPRPQPDGGVCISPAQLAVHRNTELISVVAVVPLMLWIASQPRKLTNVERLSLAGFALGALVVDAALLNRFRGK